MSPTLIPLRLLDMSSTKMIFGTCLIEGRIDHVYSGSVNRYDRNQTLMGCFTSSRIFYNVDYIAFDTNALKSSTKRPKAVDTIASEVGLAVDALGAILPDDFFKGLSLLISIERITILNRFAKHIAFNAMTGWFNHTLGYRVDDRYILGVV